MRRHYVLGLALAASVLVTPVPTAGAAGVGGVEVRPPAGSSFSLDVREDDWATQRFMVENVVDRPTTVRLYGARARRADAGAWDVSSTTPDWLELADQRVHLEPGESREMVFRVRGTGRDVTGAVVVEVPGSSLVARAATLVYVHQRQPLPIPLLLIGVAALLVAGTGALAVATGRRRRPGTPVRSG